MGKKLISAVFMAAILNSKMAATVGPISVASHSGNVLKQTINVSAHFGVIMHLFDNSLTKLQKTTNFEDHPLDDLRI